MGNNLKSLQAYRNSKGRAGLKLGPSHQNSTPFEINRSHKNHDNPVEQLHPFSIQAAVYSCFYTPILVLGRGGTSFLCDKLLMTLTHPLPSSHCREQHNGKQIQASRVSPLTTLSMPTHSSDKGKCSSPRHACIRATTFENQ